MRTALVVGLVVAGGFLMPAGAGATAHAAHASPHPSTKQLTKKLAKLNNTIERVAEQYNAQRIQRKQAKRAYQVAGRTVRRKRHELRTSRAAIARLAAGSYMTHGMDPSLELATSNNPDAFINQSTLLHHIGVQDGAHIKAVLTAKREAVRAQRAAKRRKAKFSRIVHKMAAKKSHIQSLVHETQNKVFSHIAGDSAAGKRISPSAIPGDTLGDRALRAALTQQGKPYVWGAAGPNSYDCSGLMMWAYARVGIHLPHYTVAQYHAGHVISASEARPGDLILFYPPTMHHVGMYIGDGMMIHAPHTGSVVQVAPIGNRPIAAYVRVY